MQSVHSLALVLHAHQPLVRHPEYPRFLEERWLFEAISESYLPLLAVFERLERDAVPFKVSLSISPTLSHMLQDDLLQHRYIDYLDRMIEFGSQELERTTDNPAMHRLARYYYDKAVEDRHIYAERYERDILKAFDYFHKKGLVELLTSSATHAVMPFWTPWREAIQAQLELAQSSHRKIFSRIPKGFWLPNLAWEPTLERRLKEYGFAYTIVDSHAILHANPPPEYGTFKPVVGPEKLVFFARDIQAVTLIQDSANGFVSHGEYRDFHRDIGFELESEQLESMLDTAGTRVMTGFKYWKNAGSGMEKEIYDGNRAQELIRSHATLFLEHREALARDVNAAAASNTCSVCAFNAEFFGHWWFEGPQFLEEVFRQAAERGGEIQFSTPTEILEKKETLQELVPEYSSWGANGYAEDWLDSCNDWTYRHIARAVDRMIELAERFPDESGLKERSLNQAAREVVLAQASDWAYMMKEQSSPEYARKQIEECVRNFTTVYDSLGGNYISTEWLTNLEKRHNIFPNINYRMFRKKQ